tara:strand:- start:111 stop:446 length:336 start_codon:yes stop_codon:yes gene_type:complete
MAAPTFYIKQNDTRPELDVFLRDDKDRTINVTGATVKFNMRNASDNVVKVDNGSVTTVSSTAGRVKYSFSTSDTDTAGNFDGEFQVTFVGGQVETFPNDGYVKVIITDDVA